MQQTLGSKDLKVQGYSYMNAAILAVEIMICTAAAFATR